MRCVRLQPPRGGAQPLSFGSIVAAEDGPTYGYAVSCLMTEPT